MSDDKMSTLTMYPPPHPQARPAKSTLVKLAAAFGALALVGAAAVVVSHCGSTVSRHQLVQVQTVEPAKARQQLPTILRRGYNDEPTTPSLESYGYATPVDAGPAASSEISGSAASGAAAARATAPLDNTTYPISASMTTMTSVVVVPSKTLDSCTEEVEETVIVTVTETERSELPLPAYGSHSSSSYVSGYGGDVTITGNPATVTSVQTDVSYTSSSDVSGVIVSADPATVTSVQTDVSYTSSSDVSGVTVSADPATVTDLETDTHYTSGSSSLPDVTISGEPVTVTTVVTNTAGQPMTTLTFTSVRTVLVTVSHTRTRSSSSSNTSTCTSSHDMDSSAEMVTSTSTEIVTVTDGVPVTSTTFVELPPKPSYGHGSLAPYGTGKFSANVTTTVSPMTHLPPVVAAAGTTKACSSLSVVYLVTAAAMMSIYF